MNEIVRPYKPEITNCPCCNTKLEYKYTVSNKVIQFSSGARFRIKNLGYVCPNLECRAHDVIFTSQTAAKFCLKGYTYSSKVIGYITILKMEGVSRDKICARLSLLGIDISDRNIDNIAEREIANFDIDYKSKIKEEYDFMYNNYGQVRLSIDSLCVLKKRIVAVRNAFNNALMGFHLLDENDYDTLKPILKEYINDPRVKSIITVRKNTNFYKCLNECLEDNNNIEILHYLKFEI